MVRSVRPLAEANATSLDCRRGTRRGCNAFLSPGACHAVGVDPTDVGPVRPARDIADVPAVEIVSTAALHLMSAAAVQLGLAEDLAEHRDLDEARTLIDALAGLVTAGAPRLGHHHALPLRDGLRSLQLAFREASTVPDAPGEAPGERLTGPVTRT